MDYKKIQKYRERINRNRQKKSEEKDGRRKKAAYLFDSSKRLFLFNIGCTRLTGLGLNDVFDGAPACRTGPAFFNLHPQVFNHAVP